MAMAMGFIPNLDSSCSYFYRLSDSSGHFLARKKLERLERQLFGNPERLVLFFFSAQQSRSLTWLGLYTMATKP
jgi:hypothetical protein